MDDFQGGAVMGEDAVFELRGPKMQGGVDRGLVYIGEEALEVFYAGWAMCWCWF